VAVGDGVGLATTAVGVLVGLAEGAAVGVPAGSVGPGVAVVVAAGVRSNPPVVPFGVDAGRTFDSRAEFQTLSSATIWFSTWAVPAFLSQGRRRESPIASRIVV
jgi:hypothetical protein